MNEVHVRRRVGVSLALRCREMGRYEERRAYRRNLSKPDLEPQNLKELAEAQTKLRVNQNLPTKARETLPFSLSASRSQPRCRCGPCNTGYQATSTDHAPAPRDHPIISTPPPTKLNERLMKQPIDFLQFSFFLVGLSSLSPYAVSVTCVCAPRSSRFFLLILPLPYVCLSRARTPFPPSACPTTKNRYAQHKRKKTKKWWPMSAALS